ncbi:Peroxisomal hydratase-dehydrogenase-epimerase [Smittium mucronatum]|uniref:Peroxisomal hydratase-dehydrogenase-epimerase n=1 Tax=Smittium mucronatum TaxID=133383 RepID=A0A1R0GRT5_9FUNG|nr:Peroxisomal hydratase-dehydrogenase-epimerase [Smittium mucronatum]
MDGIIVPPALLELCIMAQQIRFDGRVVVITGAGGGLGKQYSLLYASRGASVVVNDFGSVLVNNVRVKSADLVVDEIIKAGGKAIANYDSVENGERLIQQAMQVYGRVDILINNAGNLRDRTFSKLTDEEWDQVYQVHLKGAYKVSAAVWPIMRKQNFGRIIMTSSTSAMYGNFGQSNYGAAKYGLVALSYCLSIEGAKYNITANTIVPTAASAMTKTSMSQEALDLYDPRYVAPIVCYITNENSKITGRVFEAAGGFFASTRWELSAGVLFKSDSSLTPAAVKQRWNEINSFEHNSIFSDHTHGVDYLKLAKDSATLQSNPQGPELRYDGSVAIVTGAGNGLGRQYSLMLARYGAKVVVNDVGKSKSGQFAADLVVQEIKAAGGAAVADYNSVENGDLIVQTAINSFGRIDILINNAGILRDKSFIKMTEKDWDQVYRVHLFGTYKTTKAAWSHFVKQKSGSIINTSSSVGLYGNFGQANYSSMKSAMLGFTNVLAIEGSKYNIRVNALAPNAGTAMTATILPPAIVELLKPDYVAPFTLFLVHNSCKDTGKFYQVGSCWAGQVRRQRSGGIVFPQNDKLTIELIRDNFETISGFNDGRAHFVPNNAANVGEIIPQIIKLNPKFSSKVQSSDSKIVDVTAARNHIFEPTEFTYTQRDVMLYAFGIGASRKDLNIVYELSQHFQTFPTFAVIPAFFVKADTHLFLPKFHPMMLLHGEQSVQMHSEFPTSGTLVCTPRIVDIADKIKGAAVTMRISLVDKSNGKLIAECESTSFIRGIGGFSKAVGFKRVPSPVRLPISLITAETPKTSPDNSISQRISPDQAAVYRLSGDYNPLHIDPEMAAKGNFKEPILHGLCTMGFASRHLVNGMAGGDPSKLKAIKVRFSSPVYPGETLQTNMWIDRSDPSRVLFSSKVVERNITVITNAVAEFYQPAKVSTVKSNL